MANYSIVSDLLHVCGAADPTSTRLHPPYKSIHDNDISVIINLAGSDSIDQSRLPTHVQSYPYILPSLELMDVEIPKTISKLREISEDLEYLISQGIRVLVYCNDGRNKSLLLIGSYLILYKNMSAADVILKLSTIYGTAENQKGLTLRSFRKILETIKK